MSTGAALLELESVSRTFATAAGPVPAVDDVSLTVHPGEVVGLVGGSGAGKTTVARLAVGLIRPERGQVRLEGQDLARLSRTERRRARRHVHLVFQDAYSALPPRMEVGDIVAEPLAIHGEGRPGEERRRRVLAALAEVQLEPPERFAGRRPGELSGGERQRVALARALVLRPRLVVADEPTAMLDVHLRAGLIRLMADRRRAAGTAYLYVTHDLVLAERFCDRLLVLSHGRLVEEGPTDDVLARPRHPATAALVDAARRLGAPAGPS